MNPTKEQCIQLDDILKRYSGQSKDSHIRTFNSSQLVSDYKIKYDLAYIYIEIIVNTCFKNLSIVEYGHASSVSPKFSKCQTNSNTIDFLNSGGFTKMCEDQEQERSKQILRDELELQNLHLGPKQFQFNKLSVWVNATLTLITIVLTVLIALGIIDK